MKPVVPYLRVLAGLFAGVTLWLALVEINHGNLAESLIQPLFFVGLGYLAIGNPCATGVRSSRQNALRSRRVPKRAIRRS